jgi:hypothetical protein
MRMKIEVIEGRDGCKCERCSKKCSKMKRF